MNRSIALLLIVPTIAALAQSPIQLKTGSTVYIEPMDGYETYLTAAIAKKQVPLIVVADRDKAVYIITSSVSHRAPSQPTVVVNNTNSRTGANDSFDIGMRQAAERAASRGATSASISVIDAQSSQVVFAYAVGKAGNTNQIQSTAEACAKHLKEFIAKQNK